MMTNEKKNKKVIIMGAGLAGLSAAFELSKKGKNVIVFEKWADVGGLARTIEKNGFRFDTGPHRWYAKANWINNWMIAILQDEIIKIPRLTRIYFDKKFFHYPIKLTNALLGIGIGKSAVAVFDFLLTRIKARIFKPKLVSMEDGYINQFGRTLYEIFFKRYSEKLWGRDCREISVDWVGQRTRGLNILTVVKDTFLKSKNVVSLVDKFSYPKRGIGRLAQRLREETKKRGGKIFTNSEVIGINHDGKKIVSIQVFTKGKKITFTGHMFISSIPINDLVDRLAPSAPDNILTLTKKLTFRDEVQVALFVKKTHITKDTWIYIHPKRLPFMRVMEMDNWNKDLSPPGTTSLVFEIACNQGDKIWNKNNEQLLKLVTNAYINEFKLIGKKDIIGGFVHRVPKEYPVYHLDYKKDLDKIKKYLKRFSNLQLIGRNGTFRYNNMDHSIEMGIYAAWNIIAGYQKYDIESVNIEREYLEEKKIEYPEDASLEKDE